jgi:hypothetical protein
MMANPVMVMLPGIVGQPNREVLHEGPYLPNEGAAAIVHLNRPASAEATGTVIFAVFFFVAVCMGLAASFGTFERPTQKSARPTFRPPGE